LRRPITEEPNVSAANNLEALINLEQNLKSQYEEKLTVETQRVKDLQGNQATLKATIEKQLVQITELSQTRVEFKRVEQENRELTNRKNNQQKEIDSLKAKAKTTQKDLIDTKATVKTLKQLDAGKIKKNLVATKSTLVEQRTANELLSKKNRELKIENSELKHNNEELQKELDELKPKDEQDTTEEDAAEEGNVDQQEAVETTEAVTEE
jgi:hypothetical protein